MTAVKAYKTVWRPGDKKWSIQQNRLKKQKLKHGIESQLAKKR